MDWVKLVRLGRNGQLVQPAHRAAPTFGRHALLVVGVAAIRIGCAKGGALAQRHFRDRVGVARRRNSRAVQLQHPRDVETLRYQKKVTKQTKVILSGVLTPRPALREFSERIHFFEW